MELSGQRILITGATGQVAGALARGLAETNEIYAFARFSAAGSRKALEAAGIRTCRGDFVTDEFDEAPATVDYVVHSAANTRPKNSEEALQDNVDGLARIRGLSNTSCVRRYAASATSYMAPSSGPAISRLTLREPPSLLVMMEPRATKARMPGYSLYLRPSSSISGLM